MQARQTNKNPRFLGPEGMFAARVIYCQWRRTKQESTFKNWTFIRPQDKQDGLQPVLRKLVDVIVRSLTMWVLPLLPLSVTSEQSWQAGEVPEEWQKANITPIFKQGKKEDHENYRLLKLISVPGKMKIIRESISQDLKDKMVIRSGGQHGFVKGTSCLTNLVDISVNVNNLLIKRREMGFVYLDFRKGFDYCLL